MTPTRDTIDQIGNVVSLGTLAALPAIVLLLTKNDPPDRKPGRTTGRPD